MYFYILIQTDFCQPTIETKNSTSNTTHLVFESQYFETILVEISIK